MLLIIEEKIPEHLKTKILKKTAKKEEIGNYIQQLSELFDATLGFLPLIYKKRDASGYVVKKIPIIEVGGEIVESYEKYADNFRKLLRYIKKALKVVTIFIDPQTLSKEKIGGLKCAIKDVKNLKKNLTYVVLISKFDSKEDGFIRYILNLKNVEEVSLDAIGLRVANAIDNQLRLNFPWVINNLKGKYQKILRFVSYRISEIIKFLEIPDNFAIEFSSSEEIDKYLFIDKIIWYLA